MNEEGWGLKEVLIFIVIVFLCIFISMTVYHKTFGDLFGSGDSYNDETYEDVEVQLENTAKTYTDNYYGKALENGDEGVVTIRDMQGEGLLTAVKDIENDSINCSGYVNFKVNNKKTLYKAYLKCADNYQTKGYQEKYDEPVK